MVGVGSHGPSGTAPGESAEWGVVSGWELTGFSYCVSSPVLICVQNAGAHGATITPELASQTYDLGTWQFDSLGDMEADFYITATLNGGTANTASRLRGAFVGTSLPALPLVGFAALAAGLAAIGGRALMGKK
jgi:hypothetical protein